MTHQISIFFKEDYDIIDPINAEFESYGFLYSQKTNKNLSS